MTTICEDCERGDHNDCRVIFGNKEQGFHKICFCPSCKGQKFYTGK